MKKQLLTAIAVGLSLCGYAQTKGTSTLGLGVNFSSNKSSSVYNYNNQSTSENKNSYFNLGYGYFVKDNTRLGIDFNYGINTSSQSNGGYANEAKIYGGNLSYQRYFPIVKTLYVYAGGTGGYAYTKSYNENENPNNSRTESNTYNIGAYGGLTWFLSKRFAFETNLLSANVLYSESEYKSNKADYQSKQKTTDFSLNTKGFIDNLGFKIYLLF